MGPFGLADTVEQGRFVMVEDAIAQGLDELNGAVLHDPGGGRQFDGGHRGREAGGGGFGRSAGDQAVIADDAALHVAHVIEAHVHQHAGRRGAATAGAAVDDHGLLRVQLTGSGMQLTQGDEYRAGQSALLVLHGLAHVEQTILLGWFALDQGFDLRGGDGGDRAEQILKKHGYCITRACRLSRVSLQTIIACRSGPDGMSGVSGQRPRYCLLYSQVES